MKMNIPAAKKMRIVALIPARLGSKRLERKNIRHVIRFKEA
jgi:CMP-N-acetylneuraminic acid synthetase